VTEVFLGLGSNLSPRKAHLAHAIRRLHQEATVTGISSVYETDPVGFRDQPPFLNMVVRVETGLEPSALLGLARSIEAERGRVRTVRDGPRTLDIDILLFGDRQVRLDGLSVPHPRMHGRRFVLVPLLEVAPEAHDPVSGRPFRELLEGLGAAPGADSVRPVMPGQALMAGGGA
jgi:2-amino-4-hydroxy-6-hydroxymethyldihydropteridine diphosphokinase